MLILAGICILTLFTALRINSGTNTDDGTQEETHPEHEDLADYVFNESGVVEIALNGDTIAVDSAGVTVSGMKATITSAGTYSISGTLNNGQIILDTEDEETVTLILNGVDISCSTSAPIYIVKSEKTVLVLAENTVNNVTDGSKYVLEDADGDEPNAAIFSKSDLTIFGGGTLNVDANYNDGIASKDGLIIKSGTINVDSVDDGIRGKDYLVIKDGAITLSVGGDGLKSDNEVDAGRGYITVEAGVISVTSGGDAIQAATGVTILGGEITLTSGGGSRRVVASGASAKGVKAADTVQIDGGVFAIDSADDAVHSNDGITINGGTFVISTGDDAIHADSTVEINGGSISITDSYEGIESAVITINDGDIHVTSSDDGINVVGGKDSSGFSQAPGRGGGGRDTFTSTGSYYLYINGGYIVVDSMGDGFDINGAIEMTGGTVIISGPTSNMNGALDYDRSFKMTGGFLVAVGSSGMAQAPDSSSTQCSVMINLRAAVRADTLVHVETSEGKELFSFTPAKAYQSIVFSSPDLEKGSTYDVYFGGSSTGTVIDDLILDGTYYPGTKYTSITVSGIVTRGS